MFSNELNKKEIAHLNKWHTRKLHHIAYRNEKAKLKAEQRKQIKRYKKRKRIQTTKIFFWFITINLLFIEVVAIYLMKSFGDLSALTTLIGCGVGDVLAFGIYCCKSYLETKSFKNEQLEREKQGLNDASCYEHDTQVSNDIDINAKG